jgi:uncharacterized protein with PIN domain
MWGRECPRCDNPLPQIELRERKFTTPPQRVDHEFMCVKCQTEFSEGDEYRNVFYLIMRDGEVVEQDKKRICYDCYKNLEIPDFE